MNSATLETLLEYSYEELSHALYVKGKRDGFHKVTDKTKWREPVMADKMGHIAHTKISAGAGTDEYGSDAFDPSTNMMAEYKSSALEDKVVRNLLQESRGNGKRFAPYTAGGVYNGAYTHDAIDKYAQNDHYFGMFVEELCVLIIKVDTDFVIGQLRETLNKKLEQAAQGKRVTTNLNTAKVHLVNDRAHYSVAFINREWFDENKGVVDYLLEEAQPDLF